MRFASIGSGSRGNATLVEKNSTCIMVDCGFSAKEVERRMVSFGKSPADIDALLVTHEHGDHIRGIGTLSRKYKIPVYMTHGTRRQADVGDIAELIEFDCHEPFAIGDLEVTPFPVPHDAREPSQFVFSDGASRFGMLTDTGSITAHIRAHLSHCDALLLECNHELDMLRNGEYPESLKRRVGGDLGHLNNTQSAGLLQSIETGKLRHLVAAHLSEKHNTPGLARDALSDALGCEKDWIGIIDQDAGLPWRQIG